MPKTIHPRNPVISQTNKYVDLESSYIPLSHSCATFPNFLGNNNSRARSDSNIRYAEKRRNTRMRNILCHAPRRVHFCLPPFVPTVTDHLRTHLIPSDRVRSTTFALTKMPRSQQGLTRSTQTQGYSSQTHCFPPHVMSSECQQRGEWHFSKRTRKNRTTNTFDHFSVFIGTNTKIQPILGYHVPRSGSTDLKPFHLSNQNLTRVQIISSPPPHCKKLDPSNKK